VRRDFWECYDGDLDLSSLLQQALHAFDVQYTHERPHQALE
jgi:hypothetical protein